MMINAKIGKTPPCYLWKALFSIFIAILFIFSSPVFADNILEIYKKFKLELSREKSQNKEWIKKFEEVGKFYEFLNAKNEELNRFKISVEVGNKGNWTDEKELFKLDVGSDISKGIYPNEFRFKTGATVTLEDQELKEDVTSLMVNYDHHFYPWLQVYGFVERFSNSYLSVQQRYEIGSGISFEWDFFSNTTHKIDKELNTLRDKSNENYKKYKNITGDITDTIYKDFEADLQHLEENASPDKKLNIELLRSKIEDLEKEEKCIKQVFKKKYAKLSVGFAISLFSEFERHKLEAYFDEQDRKATEPTKIYLNHKHRFRYVLRPLVVIRPTDNLTLMASKYYKHPLEHPYVNGKHDIRTDTTINAQLVLKKDAGGAEKVSLIIVYQRHYVNNPPRIPQVIIAREAEKNKFLRGEEITPNTHNELKFMLQISF